MQDDVVPLGEGTTEQRSLPPGDAPAPAERAPTATPSTRVTLVAAVLVVLILGLGWLNRSSNATNQFASPINGVTVPTDDDGRPADLPPSQPAVAVAFGPSGGIMRPDPVRARVVDPASGQDVIVPLLPGTTVDTVTGEVVPMTTTTRPRNTTTTGTPTTEAPTTTETPTTTEAPTTTETPTTT
jgi:hypothetical protein